MPAKDKVGAWLGDAAAGAANEAYDSDQDSSAGRANGNGADDGDGEDYGKTSNEKEKREENDDWEVVLPKVRGVLEDPSDKRRSAFIARYLYVEPDCKYSFYILTEAKLIRVAPPSTAVGALLQSVLAALPQLSLKQADDATAILSALIARDDKAESEAKQKLGEKLIKWLSIEVTKVTDSSKT